MAQPRKRGYERVLENEQEGRRGVCKEFHNQCGCHILSIDVHISSGISSLGFCWNDDLHLYFLIFKLK